MKNWLKKQISALSIAFSNVEKNILGQLSDNIENGSKQERRRLQGTLADSLVHGEITQEVKNLRWRNYKILKASRGTELEVDYIDENGNVYYKKKDINYRLALNKVKLDNFDNYELEMVFDNNDITVSIYDTISEYIKEYDIPINQIKKNNSIVTSHGQINSVEYFATNKFDKPINIVREHAPKFFIENYTKKINVRKISSDEKLLEFYISKYGDNYNKNQTLFVKHLKKIIDSNLKKSNSFDIDNVNFITNNTLGSEDFLLYSYGDLNFDKIIEFDGYYVIKFKSKVLIDGKDILLDYIEPELEKKYENKERKK